MELTEKVVTIKRVTKVVKGGRTMRFSALVVVGDNNGHVGVGLGKSTEIPEAIRKGKEDAAKHLVTVALDEVGSISHDYIGKYGSAEVLLKKSPDGTGIIAGGPARTVCELAGIKNIRTKSLGSNNKQNVVLATLSGLSSLKAPEEVAARRGKSALRSSVERKEFKMADTKKLKITLVKSTIAAVPKNKAIIKSMGFHKLNSSVILPDNDATRGQIRLIAPYVKVEDAE